jgi:hypothetical protein
MFTQRIFVSCIHFYDVLSCSCSVSVCLSVEWLQPSVTSSCGTEVICSCYIAWQPFNIQTYCCVVSWRLMLKMPTAVFWLRIHAVVKWINGFSIGNQEQKQHSGGYCIVLCDFVYVCMRMWLFFHNFPRGWQILKAPLSMSNTYVRWHLIAVCSKLWAQC